MLCPKFEWADTGELVLGAVDLCSLSLSFNFPPFHQCKWRGSPYKVCGKWHLSSRLALMDLLERRGADNESEMGLRL